MRRFLFNLSLTNFVGQVGNLRPIGNRPVIFLIQNKADYQSAAGYQPAPRDQYQFAVKPRCGAECYPW